LLDLVPLLESPEDFQEWDRMSADLERQEATQDRFDLKTLSEVAEFFGLDEHTIRTWRLKTPPMPGEPGKWPIKNIVQWRCNWIQQTDLAAAKRQQDFELGQIQVEAKRLELDREKGLILDRQDVELWASTALIELREGIMQLPEILAASAPQELKDFTRAETDRHCRDLLTATQRRLELAEIGKEGPKE
jgi:citrate lyase beta subunit